MKQNYLKEKLEEREVLAGDEKKGFIDFYKDVKEGNISPILDEDNNVIAVNASTKITSNACMRLINGIFCHGANEAECKEDYHNALKFQKAYEGKNTIHYMILAVNLLNANLNADKVVEDENGLFIYNVANRIVLDAYMNIVVDIRDEYPSKYVNNATVLNKLDEKLNSYIEGQKKAEYESDKDEDDDDDYVSLYNH